MMLTKAGQALSLHLYIKYVDTGYMIINFQNIFNIKMAALLIHIHIKLLCCNTDFNYTIFRVIFGCVL